MSEMNLNCMGAISQPFFLYSFRNPWYSVGVIQRVTETSAGQKGQTETIQMEMEE